MSYTHIYTWALPYAHCWSRASAQTRPRGRHLAGHEPANHGSCKECAARNLTHCSCRSARGDSSQSASFPIVLLDTAGGQYLACFTSLREDNGFQDFASSDPSRATLGTPAPHVNKHCCNWPFAHCMQFNTWINHSCTTTICPQKHDAVAMYTFSNAPGKHGQRDATFGELHKVHCNNSCTV
jgi:hypothetical protein